MLPLTGKELKPYQDATQCYIRRRKFAQKLAKDKTQQKFREHFQITGKYRGAALSILNLMFNLMLF